ncbi:MAG: histidine kinase [Rubrivivax sp.]|nr:histidine kinase [Rubrivivax sp.]
MGLLAALRRLVPRFAGPAGPWSPDSISAAVSGFGVISGFGALDEELQQAIQPGERSSAPTMGWRRAVLVAVALAGCLLVFVLARQLALAPSLPLDWRTGAQAELFIFNGSEPVRPSAPGRQLVAVSAPGLAPLAVDALLVHRSARWQVDDARRDRQLAQQTGLDERLATGSVTLHFRDGGREAGRDGPSVTLEVAPRGFVGLGLMFWPLAALALLLMLLGAVLPLARADRRNLGFFVMCQAQAVNLAFVAAQSVDGLGGVGVMPLAEAPLRAAMDLLTAAAALHVLAPAGVEATGAARRGWIWALAGWAVAIGFAPVFHYGERADLWWWAQGLCAALFGLACWAAAHTYRAVPDPYVLVVRRFVAAALVVWLLVTGTVAATTGLAGTAAGTAAVASAMWTLFAGSLLLLSPFVSRSRRLLRELALLAGISTVATSLDLLFAALFALGPFASLTLAVFLALGVYAGVRQWLLNQMMASQVLTTERTFEQIYRLARDAQANPARYPARAAQLLRELFDPLEVMPLQREIKEARVLGNGTALVVPIIGIEEGGGDALPAAAVLRFARRGRRLFSHDDARLAERVIDQLKRAVAYDRAVERGRAEERQRIAQDLHDDIGARLLTLMYQAQTPEMEDYIRHTLKDLKTLSRGLAAGETRLTHAAAEWKADLAQRAGAARIELDWHFEADRDPRLGVVPWSALTRVLRELVSNALAHSGATRVEVRLRLNSARLTLRVADNGRGRAPQEWSHGLGLGGVRKRVKQLGGTVAWRENGPAGIVCEVEVPGFAEGGPALPGSKNTIGLSEPGALA